MLAEREIASSSPLPLEASWVAVSTSWDPSDASKYYRARYYDPGAAVFLSADPAGLRADVNLYRYVYNNPVRYSDPSGLLGVDLCFRQMEGMSSRIKVPHPVVRPHGRGCTATGFGPKSHSKKTLATLLAGGIVPGHIADENVCDPNGNVSPRYQCYLVSDSPCVETCVTLLINAEKQSQGQNPYPYSLRSTPAGGFQCNDWAESIVQVCREDCARSGGK